MTLELPIELERQIERAARQRGTDAAAWLIELARRALVDGAPPGAPALSPMESAVAYIKANPIRSLGPVDAAADLEELRATRAEELSGPAKTETREQRRARISAAIDDAQRHFGPLLHGGDAVSQLMAEKRADVERAMERGL